VPINPKPLRHIEHVTQLLCILATRSPAELACDQVVSLATEAAICINVLMLDGAVIDHVLKASQPIGIIFETLGISADKLKRGPQLRFGPHVRVRRRVVRVGAYVFDIVFVLEQQIASGTDDAFRFSFTHLMYSGFCRRSGAGLFRLRGRQSQRHYLAERPRWCRQRQALELDLALHPAKFFMLVDSRHRLFPMIAEEAMEVNAVAGVLRSRWLLYVRHLISFSGP
jgi:hypothetical protein